jgi:hypothetical protein
MPCTIVVVVVLAAVLAPGVWADLVGCDACVAVSTEVCKAVAASLAKAGKSGKANVVAKASAIEATLEKVCDVDHMRYYTHPPPQLMPACKSFLTKHKDAIESFFESFSTVETGCRAAVRGLCVTDLDVCRKYREKEVVVANVNTLEFESKTAGGAKKSAGGIKTHGLKREEL